ncbi:alpha/beta hydrolase family protein [Mesorhizobium sp. 128a]
MSTSAKLELHDEIFSVDGVAQGVPACTEAECLAYGNSLWVEVDGTGDCIRHWSSGLSDQTPVAVFYIHGDRLWFGDPVGYEDNSVARQQAYANAAASSLGMPFIKIARPGLYGSSGKHSSARQMRELELIAGAIRQLIARHNIKRYGFAGQSGGGSVASYLLTQFPDVECVAFSAACLSLDGLRRGSPERSGYDGAGDIYDPVAHLSKVPMNPNRRLFVIGDEKDKSALFLNLEDYYHTAKSLGHNVTLFRTEGLGNHHVLDATGQHALAWALRGLSTEQIQKKIANKEIVG